MNETLNLPIDFSVHLDNASYKNPGRLLVRSQQSRVGWTVYFGVNGKSWSVGKITQGNQGTALVFGGTRWRRIPWDGQGREPEGGPNVTLAAASNGVATYDEIRAADKYAVWAVSPDGTDRSLAWWTDNDIYDTRQDSGYGTPKKTRRSVINGTGMAIPPGYEPENDMPDSLLDDVTAERAKYGTPLTNQEMGQLVNAVAWDNRAEGWGLARKSVGAHTTQPKTGIKISRDILIHAPSKSMYDVLSDVEGEARPSWNYAGEQDMIFLDPVDAGDTPPPPTGDDYEEGWNDALDAGIAALEDLKR